MIIKVCGLSDRENLAGVIGAGPDMAGFIFHAPSPRYAGKKLVPADLGIVPDGMKKTGVFVNAPEDEVIRTACSFGLEAVQLHGEETPQVCRHLTEKGYLVIKAFRVDTSFDFSVTGRYEGYAGLFLFDAFGREYGGNGIGFDWSYLGKYTGSTPFLLSGGISPGKEKEIAAVRHGMFAGIDLNSGFETRPGIKDTGILKEFIKKIRFNDGKELQDK